MMILEIGKGITCCFSEKFLKSMKFFSLLFFWIKTIRKVVIKLCKDILKKRRRYDRIQDFGFLSHLRRSKRLFSKLLLPNFRSYGAFFSNNNTIFPKSKWQPILGKDTHHSALILIGFFYLFSIR